MVGGALRPGRPRTWAIPARIDPRTGMIGSMRRLPALVLVDAVVRLIPGVVGDGASVGQDSCVSGLLDHPQYTRPAVFRGIAVPDVLSSGHHGAIEEWRAGQGLARTKARRPDLLKKFEESVKEHSS